MTEAFGAITWLVEHAKVTRDLLDLSHKESGSKAKYLLALGFTPDDPETLASTLVRHASVHLPGRVFDPSTGLRRLIVEGEIGAPDGRVASLRAV